MIPSIVAQMISKKFGINNNSLQNINTPDDMAQYLLNTGRVNQSQVNMAKQQWNDPQVRQNINNNYNLQ